MSTAGKSVPLDGPDDEGWVVVPYNSGPTDMPTTADAVLREAETLHRSVRELRACDEQPMSRARRHIRKLLGRTVPGAKLKWTH